MIFASSELFAVVNPACLSAVERWKELVGKPHHNERHTCIRVCSPSLVIILTGGNCVVDDICIDCSCAGVAMFAVVVVGFVLGDHVLFVLGWRRVSAQDSGCT